MRADVRKRQQANRNRGTDMHGIPLGRGKLFPFLSHIDKTKNRPLSPVRKISHLIDGGPHAHLSCRSGVRRLAGPQSEHAEWSTFTPGRRLLKPHRDGFHKGRTDRRRILKAVDPVEPGPSKKLQYGGKNNELSTGIIRIEDNMVSKRRLKAPISKRFDLSLAMGRKKHVREPRTVCMELKKGAEYKSGYFALSRTERAARARIREHQKMSNLEQRGGGSAGQVGTSSQDGFEGATKMKNGQRQALARLKKISFEQKRLRRMRAMDMADVASLRRWERQTGKQLNDLQDDPSNPSGADADAGPSTAAEEDASRSSGASVGGGAAGFSDALQLSLGKWLDEPLAAPGTAEFVKPLKLNTLKQ